MPWSPRLDADEWFFGLRTAWRIWREATNSAAHATRAIVAENADGLNSDPARSIFWLILAHYQWQDGCLQPGVRRKALAIIQRGPRRILWLHPGTRVTDFARLRRQLLSPQPRPAPVKHRPLSRTRARPGDLIQVGSPTLRVGSAGGPFLLLQVVRIARSQRALVPVCVVFRWRRRVVPTAAQLRRLRPIVFRHHAGDIRGGVAFSAAYVEGLAADHPGARLIRTGAEPTRFTTAPICYPVQWATIDDELARHIL